MKGKELLLVLFALPLAGATNCSLFSTVTVPATDTVSPTAGWKVVEGGVETVKSGDSTYTTSNFGQVVLVPYGVDAGGMKRLEVVYSVVNANPPSCLDSPVNLSFSPSKDTQSGGVGSSVSNGIYLFKGINIADFLESSSCRITFTYRVEAEDFAGNESPAQLTLIYD